MHGQKEDWKEVPRTQIAQGKPPPAQTHRPTQLAVVLPLGDGVEGVTAAPAALFFLVTLGLRGPSPGLKLQEANGDRHVWRGGCVIHRQCIRRAKTLDVVKGMKQDPVGHRLPIPASQMPPCCHMEGDSKWIQNSMSVMTGSVLRPVT